MLSSENGELFINKKFYTVESQDNIDNLQELVSEKELKYYEERFYLDKNKQFAAINNYDCDLNNNCELEGKNILLINSGKFTRVTILSSLKRRNFKIYCINPPEFQWAKSFVDHMHIIDVNDRSDRTFDLCYEYLRNFIQETKLNFDGIITLDDYSTILVSKLAKAFNLVSIDSEVAVKVYDKYQFKLDLKKFGLFDHPLIEMQGQEIKNLYSSITALNLKLDKKNLFHEMGLINGKQYIIKDIYGCGKNFVRHFKDSEDLLKIFEVISTDSNLLLKKFLIEEFFEGLEVDIDIIVQDLNIKFLAITDNRPTDKQFFLEHGGNIPSAYICASEYEQIKSKIQKMIESLNINNILLHFEAFCKPKSLYGDHNDDIPFYPIECNIRVGGTTVFTYMYNRYHYHLIINQIKINCGLKAEFGVNEYDNFNKTKESNVELKLNDHSDKKFNVFCACRQMYAHKSGVIKNISFTKDFFSDESLVDICILKKVGEFVDKEKNQLFYWITARSSLSVQNAIEKVDTLVEKILIEIN